MNAYGAHKRAWFISKIIASVLEICRKVIIVNVDCWLMVVRCKINFKNILSRTISIKSCWLDQSLKISGTKNIFICLSFSSRQLIHRSEWLGNKEWNVKRSADDDEIDLNNWASEKSAHYDRHKFHCHATLIKYSMIFESVDKRFKVSGWSESSQNK